MIIHSYSACSHSQLKDHISAQVENDPAFAEDQVPPSVVFYAIRNILRPSFILGQIPDLLDLLAMVDVFRRYAVKVSSAALSWQEYYTKDPGSDVRLLTKHELKKLEGYIAKDKDDRLVYMSLIKDMILLVCFSGLQARLQFSFMPHSMCITLIRHLSRLPLRNA
jgi:hypothetical protein